MSDPLAVTIGATRADGTVEQVRVGTAERTGDGYAVTFFPMTIGGQVGAVSTRPEQRSFAGPPGDATVFPPYGRSKGQPIRGATAQDLEFYAGGCRRTLADPAKSRWHDKERVLLATIEAEMARQRGEAPAGREEPPPPGDDDVPF